MNGRALAIGEGMLELSGDDRCGWRLHHGGDVVNTAVHLARLGHPVRLLTAIGDDAMSNRLIGMWQTDGLDTTLVRRIARAEPGLYAITVDPLGERSFSYWRANSAAQRTLAGRQVDELLAEVGTPALVYLSLVTLAVMHDAPVVLPDLIRSLKAAGATVAFDTNYRPSLWPDVASARAACRWIQPLVDIALPSADDEDQLWGKATVTDHARRWLATGAREVVVKQGGEGCTVADTHGREVVPTQHVSPLDTSGAGDAFNAAYLHARLAGDDLITSARAGHRLASWAVRQPGAAPSITLDAPYNELVKPLVDQ